MANIVPGGRTFFYKKITITSTTFPNEPQIRFPFLATRVIIVNDSKKDNVEFSFNKPSLDGELFCTDGPIVFDGLAKSFMHFRKLTGDIPMRVWAWRL